MHRRYNYLIFYYLGTRVGGDITLIVALSYLRLSILDIDPFYDKVKFVLNACIKIMGKIKKKVFSSPELLAICIPMTKVRPSTFSNIFSETTSSIELKLHLETP